MKPILLACAASLLLSQPARAVELVPFWEQQRQKFIDLSAMACEGDSAALAQIKWHIAEEENPVAMNSFAWMMGREGCPGYGTDVETQANIFRRSAELGYPVGAHNYAINLMEGDGVERDWDLAYAYFVTAFEGGYHKSAATLAEELARGEHMARDLEDAEFWLWEAEHAELDSALIEKARAAIAEAQGESGGAPDFSGLAEMDDDAFDLWLGGLGRGD